MASTKPLAKVEDHVDIDPKMEWVKNDGFDTLLVHLPGFTKQQIKIQANIGEQKLKITGESHQEDNKWIRFKKKLTVSSDYDLNQVRARFEGGVLYIKHPKKITSPTKPVQENNADPSVEPQKPANEKPEDQNSGQDPAAQEVPPKTEVEGQTRGDIDGKTNATSTEANLKDQKSDYILPEEGKATGTSEKHETDGGGGLVANKKKLRISTTVVVSAGLFVLVLVLVLVLGLYVQKAMRSHGEYEN
ncbi:hypothetical protein POTOM_035056 [Populus tomentosa]|uniref:SHSP domain-containing protein n=1 Tax=Populus tomentosa TaxID=118781 RepID=A0A8X7Z2C7_POPTO|nr:hypothetical protein POTOM_035056 [Populus tomentosa]